MFSILNRGHNFLIELAYVYNQKLLVFALILACSEMIRFESEITSVKVPFLSPRMAELHVQRWFALSQKAMCFLLSTNPYDKIKKKDAWEPITGMLARTCRCELHFIFPRCVHGQSISAKPYTISNYHSFLLGINWVSWLHYNIANLQEPLRWPP